jgi:hypothetical protein
VQQKLQGLTVCGAVSAASLGLYVRFHVSSRSTAAAASQLARIRGSLCPRGLAGDSGDRVGAWRRSPAS